MNTELEKELKEIEISIEELQIHVDRKAMLKRLMTNPDFQELIEKDYFINEASRMLLLRDDPNLPPAKKAFLEADLYGPGAFKRYLNTIFQLGDIAENNIAEMHETIEEINDQIAQGDDE